MQIWQMSAMRHAAQQRGMGELSGTWWEDWGKELIPQGFDFGKTFITAKYAKDAAPYTQGGGNAVALNNNAAAAQVAALLAAQQEQRERETASAAISERGIRIGKETHLSWPLLGLGVVAFMLIQSKGFEKRR